ncbi:hypothetical protein SAMN05216601_10277 [Ectopseudomonas composti]|jgi:hypothetical protein|uniref:Uncharacterized protein n=1 Tax=Ectopseudomonas composti TaxID=658457 RepID=A0A1I5K289_9GAMM|nr:hypothetical protein SAMN05216601_10277 [Pseudomonas composti]
MHNIGAREDDLRTLTQGGSSGDGPFSFWR